MMRRRVLYCRVSTKEQGASGLSLEAQQRRLEGLAVSRDWAPDTCELVVEVGSGRSLQARPGLRRVLEAARKGEVEAVCVCDISRLSRSLRDSLHIFDVLDEAKAGYVSVAENFDTTTAHGRAAMRMSLVWAELWADTLSERTRAALAEVRARGIRVGSPPYGWRVVEGRLRSHDDELRSLMAMVEMLDRGETYADVARSMNEQGRRPRRAPEWTRHLVRQILLHYLGRHEPAHPILARGMRERSG